MQNPQILDPYQNRLGIKNLAPGFSLGKLIPRRQLTAVRTATLGIFCSWDLFPSHGSSATFGINLCWEESVYALWSAPSGVITGWSVPSCRSDKTCGRQREKKWLACWTKAQGTRPKGLPVVTPRQFESASFHAQCKERHIIGSNQMSLDWGKKQLIEPELAYFWPLAPDGILLYKCPWLQSAVLLKPNSGDVTLIQGEERREEDRFWAQFSKISLFPAPIPKSECWHWGDLLVTGLHLHFDALFYILVISNALCFQANCTYIVGTSLHRGDLSLRSPCLLQFATFFSDKPS